jgi:hypothetical protein
MVTIETFRSSEVLTSAFAELLKTPEMKAAVEALRNLGCPREIAPPTGVGFSEWNSHQNARFEGFNHAIDALLALGVPMKPRKSDSDLMPNLEPED